MNIQIKSLYLKEYIDELTSQKKQNEVEISKLLSTTNVQKWKLFGKYKKTKIIENNKNLEQVKNSNSYLRRIKIKQELQEKN